MKADSLVEVKCDCCGRQFTRRRKDINSRRRRGYKHTFCSRACHGKYVFSGARPHTRKYDYEDLLRLRGSGYKLREISEITGISLSHACKAMKKARTERRFPI